METTRHPIPGVDYPRTMQEFDDRFPNEDACQEYILRLRWPDGFVCPKCQSTDIPLDTSRDLFYCRACNGQTSITAGTIFEGTRKPLRSWFHAMWLITSQKNGASAMNIKRVLGLGSYQTAWAWLHKMRRAMIRPGRDCLHGPVEIDETYVGGPEEGHFGRGAEKKVLVVIAVELDGKKLGRVRLRRVENASSASLLPFVTEVVEPGATTHTDGWSGYSGLKELGFDHQIVNITKSEKKAHEVLPHVHLVATHLKRWLIGTLQGGVQNDQLEYYLDEFTFRFNRRTSKARGLLFHRLIQQAVVTKPAPYRSLVANPRGKIHKTKTLDRSG
ncbi:MAG: IS1595 family transposase [Magnetococcales bacterium]|nr:IS1595 family transposase [Magnetococcales bacterium]